MIPSLCRHILPRTATVVAHHSSLIRPAVLSSIQEVSTSARRYYSPLDANPTSTSTTTNDDDKKPAGLSRDAIADIISDEYGLTLAESKRILATVFDTIVESVASKDTVTIPGFGKFEPLEVTSRSYSNPQNPTGPKIEKAATTRVKFRPFKHFKDCVAEGKVH